MKTNRTKSSRTFYLKHRQRILKRVQAWRNQNRDAIRKRQREKYATNSTFRKKLKKYQVRYRKENREKVYAYQRVYRRTKLREWHNAYKRKWTKTPKGKALVQLKGYRRRALLKDIGTHTKKEWLDIVKKHKNRCAICRKKRKLTKDHIVPLTKGGRNTADNLQPLCAECNGRKGNRLSTGDIVHTERLV